MAAHQWNNRYCGHFVLKLNECSSRLLLMWGFTQYTIMIPAPYYPLVISSAVPTNYFHKAISKTINFTKTRRRLLKPLFLVCQSILVRSPCVSTINPFKLKPILPSTNPLQWYNDIFNLANILSYYTTIDNMLLYELHVQ